MKTFNEWWKFRHPRTGIYNHERVEDTSGQSSRLAWDAAMEEAQLVITLLQEQLAERDKNIAELHSVLHERDKIILEQQARIEEMLDVGACMRTPNDLPALEAALKAERIKTLEDAAANTCMWKDCRDELRRMANELKEQS